jgi:hypothetical protein
VAQKNKTFLNNYLFSIDSIGKVYVPCGCYIMQNKTKHPNQPSENNC